MAESNGRYAILLHVSTFSNIAKVWELLETVIAFRFDIFIAQVCFLFIHSFEIALSMFELMFNVFRGIERAIKICVMGES